MTQHISLNVQASVGLKDFQETADLEIPDDWDVGAVVSEHLRGLCHTVAEKVCDHDPETFDNESATD